MAKVKKYNPDDAYAWSRRLDGITPRVIQLVEAEGGNISHLLGFLNGPNAHLFGKMVMKGHMVFNLEVFCTVVVGDGRTFDDYVQEIRRNGCRISDWAMEILENAFVPVQERQEFDLVLISAGDLGFPEIPLDEEITLTQGEVFDRALYMGLELCPPQLPIEWCRQYAEIPWEDYPRESDPHYNLAMEPVHTPLYGDQSYGLITIGYHDFESSWGIGDQFERKSSLGGDYANRERKATHKSSWLFVRPRHIVESS